jgi:hypothetical protein
VVHAEIIEEFFDAWYQFQTAPFEKKAEAGKRYEAILQKLINEFGLNREKGLGPRYGTWMRRNKLPQPPKE